MIHLYVLPVVGTSRVCSLVKRDYAGCRLRYHGVCKSLHSLLHKLGINKSTSRLSRQDILLFTFGCQAVQSYMLHCSNAFPAQDGIASIVTQIAYAVWRAAVLCQCDGDNACETRFDSPQIHSAMTYFLRSLIDHMYRAQMPWLTTCHHLPPENHTRRQNREALRVKQGLDGCGGLSVWPADAQ